MMPRSLGSAAALAIGMVVFAPSMAQTAASYPEKAVRFSMTSMTDSLVVDRSLIVRDGEERLLSGRRRYAYCRPQADVG